MNIKAALKTGTEILKNAGMETPASEAGVILCHVLNCHKVYLYTHDEDALSEEQQKCFFEEIEARASGMPAQYITGHQEFMSLDFNVNPHVLIPRQDTEILVEKVIDLSKEIGQDKLSILDLGTGSGCISVSLAYFIKNCHITAVDISEGALQTAKMNAVKNGVERKISFVLGSLFDELEGKRFDVIVSNPPYIPSGYIGELQQEVREHEPLTALDGGMDGLEFYRLIAGQASRYLNIGGILAFEVGFDQADAVAKIMEHDFITAATRDLAGINRVITGKLK